MKLISWKSFSHDYIAEVPAPLNKKSPNVEGALTQEGVKHPNLLGGSGGISRLLNHMAVTRPVG